MFNRVDQLSIDWFWGIFETEMLLIYNSNGKLENVKAEVEQTAETRSLLELESLEWDLKIRFRCKNYSLMI